MNNNPHAHCKCDELDQLELTSQLQQFNQNSTGRIQELERELTTALAEKERFSAELEAIQKHIRANMDSDVIEGCAPAECVALLVSQRDNAERRAYRPPTTALHMELDRAISERDQLRTQLDAANERAANSEADAAAMRALIAVIRSFATIGPLENDLVVIEYCDRSLATESGKALLEAVGKAHSIVMKVYGPGIKLEDVIQINRLLAPFAPKPPKSPLTKTENPS